MPNATLLKLLDTIEAELKKADEWPSERSQDLDWFLPFAEFLQYVGIPNQRNVLLQGALPECPVSWYDSISTEWLRNPKFKVSAEAVIDYLNKLADLTGVDRSYFRPLQFFSLLSDEDVQRADSMIQAILQNVPSIRHQLPEHEDTLSYLETVLSSHQINLEKNEVPPALNDSVALYFSVVDLMPNILPIESAIIKYQTWLLSNPDNQRTQHKLSSGLVEIEIEIPAQTVKQTIDEVAIELGKSIKVPGHKLGQAPVDVLKSDVNSKKRIHEAARERLVRTEFEKRILHPWPKMKDKTIFNVNATIQPLSRIHEQHSFKFRVAYNDELIEK